MSGDGGAVGRWKTVSIILPAYNEGEVIDQALRRVEQVFVGTGLKYEVIVVDDGSTDKTRTKALAYAQQNGHVKVVSHPTNMGKGAALKTGFQESGGDIVVLMDSDLEIDPQNLHMYIEALENADVAIGSKWHPQSKVETPLARRILSRGFYALAKLLVGIKVSDTQAGLKAFRRGALEKLVRAQFVKRYSFDVELLAIASLLKLKVVELPVNMTLKSGFKLRAVARMLVDLLGIAYRLRVKRLYQRLLTENHANSS